MSSYLPAQEPRPEGERALLAGLSCEGCGVPLTGRQRKACSPRCRAKASRDRRAQDLLKRNRRIQEALKAALQELCPTAGTAQAQVP